MRRVRKQKNIIIVVVMLALFVMVSGYAIYQKKLDIGGVANIDWKDWNIRILSIENIESSSGVDVVDPSHTNTTAKFNSKITKVGGYIKYKIVVKNSGTIDGVLGAINLEESSNSVITYTIEGAEVDDELLAGEEATIYVTATYDSSKVDTATSNKSNVTLNLTYVQLEGYVLQNSGHLAVRAYNDTYWLNPTLTNDSIESITFTNSRVVPEDAASTAFDASAEGNSTVMGYYYDTDSDGLYEVFVGADDYVKANENSSNLFRNLKKLTSIDFTYFDTSETTDMGSMFYDTTLLTTFDVSNFNTSNVTDMSFTFSGAESVKSLDLTNWNTSNVTDMSFAFNDMTSLTSLIFGDWDTLKVNTMSAMFLRTSSLPSIDMSSFETANVTDMSYIFKDTTALKSINLENWNTGSVKTMYSMFENSGVTSLDLDHFVTTSVTNMSYMFSGTTALTDLSYANFNTSSVTNMSAMFKKTAAKTLNVSHFDTSNVNNMSYMFRETNGTITGIEQFKVGKVTTMAEMLYKAMGISSLDLSTWDVSKLESTYYMFYGSTNLTSLNVDNWNTVALTNMAGMFFNLEALPSLNVKHFNTSNVTNMSSTFAGMDIIDKLEVENWDTSKVQKMSSTFSSIPFKSIDLSNWNVSAVDDMKNLFSGATSLETIDLTGWNTSNVTDMTMMFFNNKSLKTIYVDDNWDISKVTSFQLMFDGDTSIVGGSGTTYDYTKIAGEYANYQYGYLTYKNDNAKFVPAHEGVNLYNASGAKFTKPDSNGNSTVTIYFYDPNNAGTTISGYLFSMLINDNDTDLAGYLGDFSVELDSNGYGELTFESTEITEEDYNDIISVTTNDELSWL